MASWLFFSALLDVTFVIFLFHLPENVNILERSLLEITYEVNSIFFLFFFFVREKDALFCDGTQRERL